MKALHRKALRDLWWMRGQAAAMAQGIVAVAAMLLAAALCNRWIKLSLHMASLPEGANVQFVTVMATNMPFIGRG